MLKRYLCIFLYFLVFKIVYWVFLFMYLIVNIEICVKLNIINIINILKNIIIVNSLSC